MNQSLLRLLQATRRSLRDCVLPELSTDYARAQLEGALDVLGKLEYLAVWSPDVLRSRLAAIDTASAAIAACAKAKGCALPPGMPEAASPVDQAALERAVRCGEQWLVTLSDWLFDPATALPEDLRREIGSLLVDGMLDALQGERRLVSQANYSSISTDRA